MIFETLRIHILISLIIPIDIGYLNLISHNNNMGAIQERIDGMTFELKEFSGHNPVSMASSACALQTINYSQKCNKNN